MEQAKSASHVIDGGSLKNDRQDQKAMVELVDPEFILGTARVLTYGAKKYAPDNWMRGIEYRRIIGGMMRHLLAVANGEDYDYDTGEQHLHHLACGAMFLSHYIANSSFYVGFDDRKYGYGSWLTPTGSAGTTKTYLGDTPSNTPVGLHDCKGTMCHTIGCAACYRPTKINTSEKL